MEALMKRRQAILSGLEPLLPEAQTAEALEIFDSNFAAGTAFNLQSYVDRLYSQFKPDCARRELHRALVQSVFLAGSDDETAGVEIDSDALAANRLFAHLLDGFLERVAGHDLRAETAVRSYLIEKVSVLGLPAGTQGALVLWLARRRPGIDAPLPREGMRHLLNLAYVLVCEYLGPVVADRYLSDAVKASDVLPEARVVKPRALL